MESREKIVEQLEAALVKRDNFLKKGPVSSADIASASFWDGVCVALSGVLHGFDKSKGGYL